jgi:hypothetical protein
LRVSGRVRAEYRYFEPDIRSDSAIGWRARGRLNFDARTATAYGTLRTFIRYELTLNSGNYVNLPGGFQALTTDLNKAFIQFAGITAGRATSFFDFYANDLNWGGVPTGSDTYGVDPVVLAYTATFGGGFSATVSLEDPGGSRRVGGGQTQVQALGGVGPGGFGPIVYSGQRMPEIVGNLRVDQAWGSAQIAGAVHQIFSGNRDGSDLVTTTTTVPGIVGGVVVPVTTTTTTRTGPYVDTEYGFAITGGLKINLPFIAPGDVFWLQGTYANGAVNYLGVGGTLNQRGALTSHADAIVDDDGDVQKTEGFVILAAFLHYWTPQIRQSVFGSYGQLEYDDEVRAPRVGGVSVCNALATAGGCDTEWWMIGSNLIWSPVRDLDIGVEVLYRTVDPQGRVSDANRPGRFLNDDSAFEARLRIQRDF